MKKRSHRRSAHAHPQRQPGRARESRHPFLEAQGPRGELLKDEGFIKNFRVLDDDKARHAAGLSQVRRRRRKVISGLVRVSTPGRRVYVSHDKIPSILGGMGVALISTSRGVLNRSRRPQGARGRRSARLRLVEERHVTHSQAPIRFPRASRCRIEEGLIAPSPRGS